MTSGWSIEKIEEKNGIVSIQAVSASGVHGAAIITKSEAEKLAKNIRPFTGKWSNLVGKLIPETRGSNFNTDIKYFLERNK